MITALRVRPSSRLIDGSPSRLRVWRTSGCIARRVRRHGAESTVARLAELHRPPRREAGWNDALRARRLFTELEARRPDDAPDVVAITTWHLLRRARIAAELVGGQNKPYRVVVAEATIPSA